MREEYNPDYDFNFKSDLRELRKGSLTTNAS